MSKPKAEGLRKKLGKGVSSSKNIAGTGSVSFGDPGAKKPKKKKPIQADPSQKIVREQNDRFFSKDKKKVIAPSEMQLALLQEWLSSQHGGKKHEADPRGEIAKWCLKHGKICKTPYTTPTETHKIAEIFAALDTNKSGFLDMLELLDAMKALSGRTIINKSLIQTYLKQMDANGDGLLSLHEFTSYLAAKYLLKPGEEAHPSIVEMDEALLALADGNAKLKVANALIGRYEGGRKEFKKMESKLNNNISVNQRIDSLFQGRGEMARGRAETISRALDPPFPSDKPYQKKQLSYQAHRQKTFPKFQSMYLADSRTPGRKLHRTRSGIDAGAVGSGSASPEPSEQTKMQLKGSLKSQVRMMLIARAASPKADGRRSISPGDRPGRASVSGESKQPKSGRGSPNKTLKAPGGAGSNGTSRDRTPSPEKKRAGSPATTQTTADNPSGKSSKARNAATEASASMSSDARASAGVSASGEIQSRVPSPSSRFRPSPPPAPQPEEGLGSPRTNSITITWNGNGNDITLPLDPGQPTPLEAAPEAEKPTSDLEMQTPRDVSPSKLSAAPAVLTAASQIGGVLHFGGAPGPYNRNYFATDPSQRHRIRSACGAAGASGTMPWSISGYVQHPPEAGTNPRAGPALQHIRDQQLRFRGSLPYRPRPHTSLPGGKQLRTPESMAGARAVRARHHHYTEAAGGLGRPMRAQSSPGVSRSARPAPTRHPAPPRRPRPPSQSSRPKTARDSSEDPYIDWGSSLEGESDEIGTASSSRGPVAHVSATSSSMQKASGGPMLGTPREVSPSKAAMGRYPFSSVDEHLTRHGFQSETLQEAPLQRPSAASYTRKRYMSAPATRRSPQAHPGAVMAGA